MCPLMQKLENKCQNFGINQYLVAMETGYEILAILVQFDHENVWKMP